MAAASIAGRYGARSGTRRATVALNALKRGESEGWQAMPGIYGPADRNHKPARKPLSARDYGIVIFSVPLTVPRK
ncbi:hypothetical protein CBM2629_A170036 [Cupriavidus taiwanensis]|nr:hypothetical protein CBM2629_A170036 [Cupriavidus taiwanensis]